MSGFKTAKAVLGRRLVATSAVFALATAGVLVGTTSAVAATPKTGGTLYFITHAEQFDHVDPARVYTGRDIAFFNSYLYRNLVSYKPVKGSAGSSLVGTDGPQYLVQALDIPKNEDGSSKYAGPYKKTGQALFDKAVTCSGNTITFKLNRSFADFNYALTYPAGAPVKASKDTGDKYDLRPFASGPYKIKKYKIGDEMTLVRNTAWKRSSDSFRTPYPDDIVVRFGLAEDVRDQIILEDQIPNTVNLDGLMPANNTAFFNDPNRQNQRMNVFDPYVRYAAMNVAKGKMDNFSDPAAYKKATVDGIVWDIAQSATNQKAAVLIADAAKAAGIVIKFNFIPSGQYYSTVMNTAKQNDISSAGWGADWANASTVIPELFTQEGGFNLSQNWNDAAYAAFKTKSDKAKNETNRAAQAKMWKELAQYVMDQYWIIRPVFSKGQFSWGSKVGGVYYWEPQGTFGFGGLYVN
ncbi:MAG: hypothetical protein EBY00_03120 [Actinobacteria bacterium]|nr:hypothetical protein [Actinomycetota bacterium]